MSRGLQRKPKARKLNRTYLIVCEGTTEEIYFKDFKRVENLRHVSIKILNPHTSTPAEIIKHIGKELKRKEYDAAFCVIDGDVLPIGSKPGGKGIDVIISRPCFEIWLLLHFKYTNREFHTCDELISKELKIYIPDYEKSKTYQSKKSFYRLFRDSLSTGSNNARK
ncbi:MAG: RloB domain-containing protein, partial [bacterium]|nr:RloB domain-containing protein [bacterium]